MWCLLELSGLWARFILTPGLSDLLAGQGERATPPKLQSHPILSTAGRVGGLQPAREGVHGPLGAEQE